MKLHRTLLFLALAFALASLAHADFPVRQSGNQTFPPAVAYNSADHQYLVVWSELTWNGSAYFPALMGQRLAEDGSLLGSAFQIFFIGSNPTVAYNSSANEYLVGFNPGTGYAGQRVSATGILLGSITGLMDTVSHGRLLYNSLTNEYLFLGAMLVDNPAMGAGYKIIKIKSRKIGVDGQPMNAPVLVEYRAHGHEPAEPVFSGAFAPIQSSGTPNGRYLVVIGRTTVLKMLDSDGAPIDIVTDPNHPGVTSQYIPFPTGNAEGGQFGVDVAYGTSSSYSMTGPAFLVVWADNNNSFGGHAWTGIYGGFVDALKTDYLTTDIILDKSFPLSFEWDHWARDAEAVTWRPQVAFNYSSQKFYVAWREMPGTDSSDDTHVNHIRGADVYERIPSDVTDNVIISSTNASANPTCPAVASSSTTEHALVVWQDYRDKGSTSANVYGSVQKVADPVPPPPPPPPTTTWVVTNTNDTGSGSLRQAILNANSRTGLDTIVFDIPGTVLHTIQPLSALPTITDPVLIDGYTQPGSSVNTSSFANGLNTVLRIELDGSNAGTSSSGLRISGGQSIVRGLVINRFDSCGISVGGLGENTVEGNYIGMDATGSTPLNNRWYGVNIDNSPDNHIGGTTPGVRNLITGNGRSQGSAAYGAAIQNMGNLSTGTVIQGNLIGVSATGRVKLDVPLNGITISGDNIVIGGTAPGAGNVISGNNVGIFLWEDGCTVQGNYVGTDITGTAPLGNRRGIQIFGGNNLVGGLTATARNIISGNSTQGIFIGTDGRTGNIIQGNFIGTQIDGTSNLGNGAEGILADGAQNCVTIGGTDNGAGNIIAFNGIRGIRLPLNFGGIRILGNSIFANSGLGIDLAQGTEDVSGVTANDPGDADTGPNGLQNYPVLTSVEGGDYLSVSGTLNSAPNTAFRVEFFSTPIQETGGSRQGKTYLTNIEVVTDGSGNSTFSFTYGFPVGPGNAITATATDPNGNTSEFSDPVLIPFSSADFVVTSTNDDGPGSLRQAILAANALPGRDTIAFNIPGAGPHTITPATPLPEVADPVVIDGYTQPGSSVNTNELSAPCNAVLKIILDGSAVKFISPPTDGIHLIGGSSVVRGLVIGSFGRYGICIDTKGSNVVAGNFIGTDDAGLVRSENTGGVSIQNVSYNLIGGTTPAARNVISGNSMLGISIVGAAAQRNDVQGNYVGLNSTGAHALPNWSFGINIVDGSYNTIGGTMPGAGNVIAGFGVGDGGTPQTTPTGDGIAVSGSATKNVISGNLIGTNAAGDDTVAGYGIGILVNANGNMIGGTGSGARNIISGNREQGMLILGDSNIVKANYIGTDVVGSKALPNRNVGIVIVGKDNLIGGGSAAEGNVISGNDTAGVVIFQKLDQTYGRRNRVQGNLIGTQAVGGGPLGNAGPGVLILNGCMDNAIGDTVDGAGNTIAFNLGDGVRVDTIHTLRRPGDPDLPAARNRILGNSVFSNGGLGINLVGGVEDDFERTANDAMDADAGPNELQNYPVITAVQGGNSLTVHGSLNSLPDSTFRIEFFATPAGEVLKYGEGQTFIGSITVHTDASGHAVFGTTFGTPVSAGRRITATATDGQGNTSEFSDPVLVTTTDVALREELPLETSLLQNYPNPFNPKTGIRYQVGQTLGPAGGGTGVSGVSEAGVGNRGSGSSVKLVVYDLLGREVAVLVDERKAPGRYEVSFDGSGLASGVYIYRMTVGSFVSVKTMLLVK
jgi:hypothetical protein